MADQRSYFVPFDLDTGAGTELVIGVSLRISGSGGSIEAKGQQTMANSIPVAIASDQSSLTVDTELGAAAAISADNQAAPTAPNVYNFGLYFDGTNWDRVRGDSTDGLLVNLGTNNDVTVSGTVTVDSELPAAAALADDTANPTVPGVGAFGMGWDSGNTNWNRVEVDDAGHLQVDVLTGGGSDTPTTPVTTYVTSTATQGQQVNLDTGDVNAKKLAAVEVWSSVAYKAFVHSIANGVESTDPLVVGGGQAHASFIYNGVHRNYFTVSSSAGVDGFRVKVTNLDDNQTADVYATFHLED